MVESRRPRAKTDESRGSPRIVILADDLSSATDCGVQMARGGYRTVVPLRADCALPGDADIVAFDVDSRALSAEQAYSATRACLQARRLGRRTVVYKSMDSTLRGNLGAEIAACLDAARLGAAVIAPAFPTYGRTTRDGIQLLNGVPIHETEFGSDPTAPVRTSVIADRIAEQNERAAALVTLDIQRDGAPAIRRFIESRIEEGIALFVFDAIQEADLERFATSIGILPFPVLWVGSTGLSRYVPKAIGLRSRASRPQLSVPDGIVVIVAGSASETTRRQLDACARAGPFTEIRVDALSIARGGVEGEEEVTRARALLETAVADNMRTVALTLTSTRAEVARTAEVAASRGMTPAQVALLLVRTLGRLAADLLKEAAPLKGLVLTGGDTAKTIASECGAEFIEIIEEIEPGIPLGWLTGRNEMLVVTKAGGFGSEDSLAGCVERIRAYGQD